MLMFELYDIGMGRRRRHCRNLGGGMLLATAALAAGLIGGTFEPSSDAEQIMGRAARSLNVTATAHLHLVRAEGSQLFEEGSVSGALAGSMRARLDTGMVFTGSFATHLKGGSINGHGRATPHGSGRYQSFSGSLVVTGGSGRYTHVSGHAGLYGVFDRRSDSVIVQTTGRLSY
jgi:hypothetical protein